MNDPAFADYAPPQKPDGLSPAQSAGWDLLIQGRSLADVASQVGRSTGTVSGWVKRWRTKLNDPALFTPERIQHAVTEGDIRQAAAEVRWNDNRERAALRFGATAERIAQRIVDLIDRVGELDTRGAPRGADVRDLAMAAAILTDKAELLIGNPTAHSRRSVPDDQWGAPPRDNREPRQLTEARVLDIASRIRAKKAALEPSAANEA